MKIDFEVGNEHGTYSRNWFTGRSTLTTAGRTITLENPWNPATHLGLQPSKFWQAEVSGHRVFIEKSRPVFFAGLRRQTFRIKVDGQLVAETTGY